MKSPPARWTPSGPTSVTRAPVRISTPSSRSSRSVASDSRLRQRRNEAIGRLDQRDLDVLVGIDLVEPERDDAAHGAVQLRRQFGAGRAGADDRDVELARPHRFGLGVGAQAGVDETAVEPRRLVGRVERDRVLLDARRAEIVGDAADGDHQGVVADRAHRRDEPAVLVELGGEVHQRGACGRGRSSRPGGTGNCASGPGRDSRARGGKRPCCRRRLRGAAASTDGCAPVRPARCRRGRMPAERIAEAGDELEPAGTAADHDDAMEVGVRRGLGHRLIRRRTRHGCFRGLHLMWSFRGEIIGRGPVIANPESRNHHRWLLDSGFACASLRRPGMTKRMFGAI